MTIQTWTQFKLSELLMLPRTHTTFCEMEKKKKRRQEEEEEEGKKSEANKEKKCEEEKELHLVRNY